MSSPKSLDSIARTDAILETFNIAMLTTVDNEDQSLHSRPMMLLKEPFNGDLWFFSKASTTKVDEIREDQQVNISAVASDQQRYLSLSGIAVLVRDRGRMQELWKEEYRAWFPEGLDHPDLALIRVSVYMVEYWDSRNRMVPEYLNLV